MCGDGEDELKIPANGCYAAGLEAGRRNSTRGPVDSAPWLYRYYEASMSLRYRYRYYEPTVEFLLGQIGGWIL